MRKRILLILVFFFQIYLLFGQTTNISGIINNYTAVTSIPVCNPCSNTCNYVDVANTTGFAVGDQVLIIQMKGAATDLSNTAAFGTIQTAGNAGLYEYKTIASITGSRLTFTGTLYNTYDVAGLVQLVRVPQYVNAVVTAKLTAQPWNGVTGGILVFDVSGTLTLNADVDVTALGFRGGIGASNGTTYTYDEKDYFYTGTIYELAAPKGEGIATMVSGHELGRGAYANAGGGGNAHNGGGGGGSNAGAGGLGGNQYNTATGSLANGVGGHAISYTGGDRMYMGGGGGAGHQNDHFGTDGANGGGMIFINAATVIGNNHTIIASGDSSKSTTGGGNDGAGGGGGGGVIKMNTTSFSGNISLIASGGKGGDNTYTAADEHAPGGGGGGGIICLAVATTPAGVTVNVSGGAPGLHRTSGDNFGTTAGADGQVLNSCNFVIPSGPKELKPILGSDIQLCNPIVANLDARLIGSWYTYTWFKDNVLISGATAQTYSTNETGRFKVVVSSPGCIPGVDSVDVTTNAATAVNATFCAPPATSVLLEVTGSGEYKWWDDATAGDAVGKGLTFTTVALSATKTYYVEDTSTISGSVGPTVLNTAGLSGNSNNSQLGFSISQDIEITSFRVPFISYYSPAAGFPEFTITVEVIDASGASFSPAQVFTSDLSLETVPGDDGGNSRLYTFPFSDFHIPASLGSNLRLRVVSSTHGNGAPQFNQGASMAYPYMSSIPGVISINGSYTNGSALNTSDYASFYDWQFKTRTSLCLRVPVVATLSCPPGACAKPTSVSLQLGSGINDTLCVGNALLIQKDQIDTSAASIDGFYFSWRKVNSSGSSIIQGPSKTYADLSISSVALADSGTYYLVVQDGLLADPACKDSAFVEIKINQAPESKALIANHQEICLGDASAVLTEVLPPADYAGTPLYHQWYTTGDTTGTPALTEITPAETAATYNPGSPVVTQYYVRKDSVRFCPAVATNFLKIRVNNSVVTDTIMPIENDTLCESIGSMFQLKGVVDSLVASSINNGYYFTWMKLQEPATIPVVVGTPGVYADFPPTSRLAVEADSGTYYLIIQDGAGATLCQDTIKTKVVVVKECTLLVPCVKPVAVSALLTGTDTLCVGNNFTLQKDDIDTSTAPSSQGYYFSWRRINTAGSVLLAPPSATYSDLNLTNVTQADSGRYYLVVQDGIGSGPACKDSSAAISIVINAPITTPPVVAASDTICDGSIPALFTGTGVAPHYQWYISTDSFKTVPASQLIAGATTDSYQAAALSATSYFIRRDSVAACPAVNSNIITIQVDKPVIPGVVGNDTVVCSGSPILEFKEITAASGGSGTFTYQWQSSSDNSTFEDITGATNNVYQSPDILTRTYFRRIDSSGVCGSKITDTIFVDVVTGVNAGIVSGASPTICYNTVPTVSFTNVATASDGSGGPGSDTYQWQISTDGNYWTDIAGATGLSYTETNALTDTTYYRREVGMGPGTCDTSYTLPIAINVYDPFVVGSIPADLTVCEGTSVTINELIPTSGGGEPNSQIYEWIESIDKGNTWTISPGISNQVDYTTPALTDSIWYRRVVTVECNTDTSNVMKIHVDSINTVRIAMTDVSSCSGTDAVFAPVYSGEGPTPLFEWYTRESITDPWRLLANTDDTLKIMNTLAADEGFYRVILVSSFDCKSGDAESIAELTVNTVVVPEVSIVTDPAGALCDTTSSITYIATAIAGDGGAATYQWYDGFTNLPIPSQTGTSYTPAVPPSNGGKVYVIMTSDIICATPEADTSNTITLDVRFTPNPVITNNDTTVCASMEVILQAGAITSLSNQFQWYKDGILIPNENRTFYRTLEAGKYTFVESNGACSIESDTVIVTVLQTPSVNAGSDITAVEGETISLNGSVSNATSYAWIPSGGLNDAYILNPSLVVPGAAVVYTLAAYNNINGKTCSSSDPVTIIVEKRIVIPNVITVNGDGVNDTWYIENMENFPNVEVLLYNRWGNLVWKSTGYNKQWDGTNYRNGEELPDGTYFYIIDLHSVKVKDSYTGWVQIVK